MTFENNPMTIPSRFLFEGKAKCPASLLNRAKQLEPLPFAFVRATGSTVLKTARDASIAKLIKPILVGETAIIERDAAAIGWPLKDIEIVQAVDEVEAVNMSVKLFLAGKIGGLIKGQIHTDIFMSGIVKRESKIRLDNRLIHVFTMLPPNGGKPLLISDAAINIQPDTETRLTAALAMADIARKFGIARPRIAILSATESLLPRMQSSIEAREIAARASEDDKNADFAGPLSFDLAISPKAAASKGVFNPVAGMADGLVVPDIVSGNILFKSLVWCAGGLAAGVVLGGAIPIVLTSRSDPPAARLASLALAVICNKR